MGLVQSTTFGSVNAVFSVGMHIIQQQSSDLIAALSRFQKMVEVCCELASLYQCAETIHSLLHRGFHAR